MFRRRSKWRGAALAGAWLLLVLLPLGQASAQDRTADWLDANGLDGLLALHLEQERATAVGNADRRRRLAVRLATVYARQLEHELEPGQRATIVAAASQLLKTGEAEEADALRLALLRAQYATASGRLENGRAALETEEAVEEAVAELTELARALRAVRMDLKARLTRTDQLLDRATGLRARKYQKAIATMQQIALAAALLEGWCLYYEGRATGSREALRNAEEAFGLVLQGDNPIPGPDEISHDRQQFEFFASGVLGMALVAATVDGYPAARAWFERLESPRTWPGIRDAVEGWRIAAAIDASDPTAAAAVVAALATSKDVPAAWLRIAAVGGLRHAKGGTPAWQRLATAALTGLAQRGELAQVVDLAEKYGIEAMGTDGFAFRYVRGVRLYREAIAARNSARESAARRLFTSAAEELLAAAKESDASQFEGAPAACLSLAGWSLIETEQFLEAASVFAEAADRGGAGRADAAWGAIVALDHVVSDGGPIGERARRERDELISAFIDRFPSDDRLPTLVVRRITGRHAPSDRDIETLRAVPEGHETWELARRRAAQALYRRFREGEVEARGADGRAFLDVAKELLERDTSREAIFSDLSGLDGVLLRQALEVATHAQVADLEGAARWIAVLEVAADHGAFEGHPGLPNELGYRRLALALAGGDLVRATALLKLLPVEPEAPEADQWTSIAARRLHRAASARLALDDATADVALAVIEAGEYLLANSHDTLEEAVKDERLLPIAASVGAARHALYLANADQEHGTRALALYEAVLAERARDGSVLEAAAKLARALGNVEASLGHWRRISVAANRGSERWWAARTNILELLEMTDPAHASEVIAQHLQLYPAFGPDPWGPRIRALSDRLDVAEGGGA